MIRKKFIKSIPIDKILIESDAPFTTTSNKEYRVNFIDNIIYELSNIYNLNDIDIAKQLMKNFKRAITV